MDLRLWVNSMLGSLLEMASANWHGHGANTAAVVVSTRAKQVGDVELQTGIEVNDRALEDLSAAVVVPIGQMPAGTPELNFLLQQTVKIWEERAIFLREEIEAILNRRGMVMNEVTQNLVFGFYMLFQVMLFAAVVQSNVLKCSQWWMPFSVSLVATILTSFAAYQKLKVLFDVASLQEKKRNFRCSTGRSTCYGVKDRTSISRRTSK